MDAAKADLAAARMEQGFNCAQAVLGAFAADFGLDQETAMRLASPFGGGMGRTAGICGAVSGALMVLGLRYGMARPEDRQAKEQAYRLAAAFIDRFEASQGSVACRQLLGRDISTPQGLSQAREEGLFASTCPALVRTAAELVSALLDEGQSAG
jgi:C_GCAxxG_C_C family probable redox protein